MSDSKTPADLPVTKHAPQLGYAKIKLSLIVGVHPCLEKLYSELSVPPMRQFPSGLMPQQALMDLLALHPLRVARISARLRCTGNVRMYHFARHFLLEATEVPCIEESPLAETYLKNRVVTELVYGSACLGAHFSDVPVVAEVARRATELGYLTPDKHSVDTLICKLYRVDKRQLMPRDEGQKAKSGVAAISQDEGESGNRYPPDNE